MLSIPPEKLRIPPEKRNYPPASPPGWGWPLWLLFFLFPMPLGPRWLTILAMVGLAFSVWLLTRKAEGPHGDFTDPNK